MKNNQIRKKRPREDGISKLVPKLVLGGTTISLVALGTFRYYTINEFLGKLAIHLLYVQVIFVKEGGRRTEYHNEFHNFMQHLWNWGRFLS